MAIDELDMMMHYLDRGLWTDAKDVPQGLMYGIGTHTDELDKYYLMKELGRPAAKPSRQIHSGLNDLLDAIERNPGDAGASCAFVLLDGDEETRNEIGEWVAKADPKTLADGGPHSISLAFDQAGHALLVVCDTRPWSRERIRRWAAKWLAKEKTNTVYVIGWNPPLTRASVNTCVFQ